MKALFADTSFFVAFLNPKGHNGELAREYMADNPRRILTTTWILLELGNFLSKFPDRRLFVPFLRSLREDYLVEILPVEGAQFERGVELYGRRPDKKWSVTDCMSFLVMKERRLTEALTADHHFEQVGFTILLK